MIWKRKKKNFLFKSNFFAKENWRTLYFWHVTLSDEPFIYDLDNLFNCKEFNIKEIPNIDTS